MVIRLTRAPGTPATARVTIGNVIRGPDKEPHLGRRTRVYRGRLTAAKDLVFRIPAPGPRFRVEVHVAPTFRPIDVNPRLSDARELGAQVTYTFVPGHR
jgi:hypothetical protein